MPVIIDGTNGITQAGEFNSDSSFGFKNRIINGAMVIDQRNAGASVTATTVTVYSVDRFFVQGSVTSKFTAQQSSTAPAGFTNSLLLTSSAATTPSASDYYYFAQSIEGLNVADLGFGTANAKTITISFWVRSSLTGTFSGAVLNSATDRSYAFTFTINSANTFEYKTVTIAGDTSGTWLKTNGVGILVRFALGAGSSFLQTANSWGTGNVVGATGTTQWISTNGATFYITGVQLEVGSTATSFDYLDYGRSLIQCQRYFEQSYNVGTVAGTATSDGCALSGGSVGGATTGYIEGPAYFKVTKRASPTILNWDLSGNVSKCNRTLSGVLSTNNSTSSIATIGTNAFSVNSASSANANIIQIQWTASAEL